LNKVVCPGCRLSLNVAQALPAQLRCPRCQTRFRAAADGTTTLNADPPRAANSNIGSRLAVLAVMLGGGFLFIAVGAGVLAYCLLAPAAKQEDVGTFDPWDAGTPGVKALPLEPVGFIKKAPSKAEHGLAHGKAQGEGPAGVAKGVGTAE